MVNVAKVLKWESEMEETTTEPTTTTAEPQEPEKKARTKGKPETRKNVYALINQVKLALDAGGGITKDKQAPGSAGGYQFRGIDDMYNALCRLTAEVGLAMLPRVKEHRYELKERLKDGKVVGYQTHAFVTMTIEFVSEHDLTTHIVRTVGEGIDSSDKATNKSLSAAFKYGCLMSFMIPTHGEMIDSEQDNEPVQPRAEKPSKKDAREAIERVADTSNRGFDSSQEALEKAEDMSRIIDDAKSPKLVFDMIDKIDLLPEPGYGVVKGHAIARARSFVEFAKDKAELLEAKNLVLRLADPALKEAFNTKYAEVTR